MPYVARSTTDDLYSSAGDLIMGGSAIASGGVMACAGIADAIICGKRVIAPLAWTLR